MKITLAFLLLGICLVSCNANGGNRQMTIPEAHSCINALFWITKRWDTMENCRNEVERFCIQKSLVEDIVYLFKMILQDIKLSNAQLMALLKLDRNLHQSFLVALQGRKTDIIVFATSLVKLNQLHHFMQCTCGLVKQIVLGLGLDINLLGLSVQKALGIKIVSFDRFFIENINVVSGSYGGGSGSYGGGSGSYGTKTYTYTYTGNGQQTSGGSHKG